MGWILILFEKKKNINSFEWFTFIVQPNAIYYGNWVIQMKTLQLNPIRLNVFFCTIAQWVIIGENKQGNENDWINWNWGVFISYGFHLCSEINSMHLNAIVWPLFHISHVCNCILYLNFNRFGYYESTIDEIIETYSHIPTATLSIESRKCYRVSFEIALMNRIFSSMSYMHRAVLFMNTFDINPWPSCIFSSVVNDNP